MELFVEQKNKNYGVVYDLLMEMEKRPDKTMAGDEISEFILKKGIYTPSFEKSLMNKWEDERENLYVLEEICDDIYTANINSSFPPPILDMEIVYLKNLLDDERINIFLDNSTIDKLKEVLKTYDNFKIGQFIEVKGVAEREYSCEKINKILFLLLKSRTEKKPIIYTYITNNNQVFKDNFMLPYKIEYSIRDDKFYLIYYSLEQGRMNKGIISRFYNMELGDTYEDYDFILNTIPHNVDRQKMKEPITIEVTDRDNAVERAFHLLSCFEKVGYYDRARDLHIISIYYYEYDEAEIISRILSLGKNAKVVSPENVKMKVIQRIKKAISLYNA
ncbi:MAG: WYL domain-containing protein [Caldicoprobacterales bacterium]